MGLGALASFIGGNLAGARDGHHQRLVRFRVRNFTAPQITVKGVGVRRWDATVSLAVRPRIVGPGCRSDRHGRGLASADRQQQRRAPRFRRLLNYVVWFLSGGTVYLHASISAPVPSNCRNRSRVCYWGLHSNGLGRRADRVGAVLLRCGVPGLRRSSSRSLPGRKGR
jgi:hypothetical protein